MKKKTVYVVFHTTVAGADYKVSPGGLSRPAAVQWEHVNRDKFERPLIIRPVRF